MDDIFDLFADETPVPPTVKVEPKPQSAVPTPSKKKVTPTPTEKKVAYVEAESVSDVQPSDTPPRYAKILDCGHLDWAGFDANEIARASGHCCANHRHQVSWSQLKGAYVRPLPSHYRRTIEKERGPGFPGYCCDDEGFYIGGVANDCRHYGPDDRRCVVHGAPRPKVIDDDTVEDAPDQAVDPATEPVEDTVVVASTPTDNPPLPKASGSWKQRQMSAKRGKR